MASLIKLTKDTRVRVKRGFTTTLGRTIIEGRTGRATRLRSKFGKRDIRVWVWFDVERGRDGAWCSYRNLIRLRSVNE